MRQFVMIGKKTDPSLLNKEAEAEREKRAKIIAAHPIALQLRNLQVLSEIAVEKNSTIIFPNQFLSTISDVKKFMATEG